MSNTRGGSCGAGFARADLIRSDLRVAPCRLEAAVGAVGPTEGTTAGAYAGVGDERKSLL